MYDIRNATHEELTEIIIKNMYSTDSKLLEQARLLTEKSYSNKIFIRGLVEVSNNCKQDCFYCGIRKSNGNLERYRLTKEIILSCIRNGYALGLRSFVMQGGEDDDLTDDEMTDIISDFRKEFSDASMTLSLGEKPKEVYQNFFDAGADRYLLRHETANKEHYSKMHPPTMRFEARVNCLHSLKEVGFQTGAGFMVGSPFQKPEDLATDLLFLKELQPHMVGLGPFIAQKDSPFANYPDGSAQLTLTMLALTRIMLPKAMLPATTALVTIMKGNRKPAFDAGANVVMPNISPTDTRALYTLYNGKAATGAESAEGLELLKKGILEAGYLPELSRGDWVDYSK